MAINKETLTVVGKAGLKVGKAIIVEGTKAVAVKGVTAIIMDGFNVKDMTVDKFVSGGKVKEVKDEETKPKKKFGLFKRKEKEEINIESAEVEMVAIKDSEGEIVTMVPAELVTAHLEQQEDKED